MTPTTKTKRRNKIRILVVDDHMVMRMGLVTAASDQPDMEVVADVESGEEAVAAYRAHHPDVVIVDLRMRGLSGLDTLTRNCCAVAEVARAANVSVRDPAGTPCSSRYAGASAPSTMHS